MIPDYFKNPMGSITAPSLTGQGGSGMPSWWTMPGGGNVPGRFSGQVQLDQPYGQGQMQQPFMGNPQMFQALLTALQGQQGQGQQLPMVNPQFNPFLYGLSGIRRMGQ